MKEILIACGDLPTLKRILAELPKGEFKPVATKKGAGIAAKIASRQIPCGIVHEQLEDIAGAQLIAEMAQHSPGTQILLLTEQAPPSDGPFAAALRYPVPGPVFRRAINKISPKDEEDADLERWRAFYNELGGLLEQQPQQDYYAILGLQVGAPHHAMVTAFDRLSLRYHPDRYTQFRDERWGEAVHERTSELYKTITEAYCVLTDRRLKQSYDRQLQRGELRLSNEELSAMEKVSGPKSLTDMGNSTQSKKFLRMAQSDLAARNLSSALQNLKFAHSMEPDNVEIGEKIAELEAQLT